MLRLIGMMVTFVFTFFVYTSGQVIKSAGLGKSNTKVGASSAALSVDTLIKVIPVYGIIVDYGIPYASFSIKGKIRAKGSDSDVSIPNIKVSATDTANKIVIDSAITQADGSFSMTFGAWPMLNTWVLDVRDISGVFERKDTLITIPRDSLKGGSGLYAGAGSADIELFLKNSTAVTVPYDGAVKGRPHVIVSWSTNGAIALRYTLTEQDRVAISLFSADGARVREISDAWESSGEYNVQVVRSGLAAGAYFLKMQTSTHAAITKVQIAR